MCILYTSVWGEENKTLRHRNFICNSFYLITFMLLDTQYFMPFHDFSSSLFLDRIDGTFLELKLEVYFLSWAFLSCSTSTFAAVFTFGWELAKKGITRAYLIINILSSKEPVEEGNPWLSRDWVEMFHRTDSASPKTISILYILYNNDLPFNLIKASIFNQFPSK